METNVKDKTEVITAEAVTPEEVTDVVVTEPKAPAKKTSGKSKIREYTASLTKEELRAQCKRGQQKRQETIARKKALKEQLSSLLALPVKDKNIRKELKALGIDANDLDNQMIMLVVMWQQVLKGRANCVPAFNSLINVLGEGISTDINANLKMSFNNDLPQED